MRGPALTIVEPCAEDFGLRILPRATLRVAELLLFVGGQNCNDLAGHGAAIDPLAMIDLIC